LSTVYFLAFCGVCAVVLGVMFDAVKGVSRKPAWHVHRSTPAVAEVSPQLVHPTPILSVEPRHSAFAGLTNDEEWSMTA
jgi:hypothetical protein